MKQFIKITFSCLKNVLKLMGQPYLRLNTPQTIHDRDTYNIMSIIHL